MNLIDEEDDFAVRFDDFFDDSFEALLKFALVFCTGYQGAHIEREDLAVLQVLGHLAVDYFHCYTLGYGGFAHAGLANEDRVVFGPSGQNLEDPSYLVIPAYHRVEFSCCRGLVKVDGVLA